MTVVNPEQQGGKTRVSETGKISPALHKFSIKLTVPFKGTDDVQINNKFTAMQKKALNEAENSSNLHNIIINTVNAYKKAITDYKKHYINEIGFDHTEIDFKDKYNPIVDALSEYLGVVRTTVNSKVKIDNNNNIQIEISNNDKDDKAIAIAIAKAAGELPEFFIQIYYEKGIKKFLKLYGDNIQIEPVKPRDNGGKNKIKVYHIPGHILPVNYIIETAKYIEKLKRLLIQSEKPPKKNNINIKNALTNYVKTKLKTNKTNFSEKLNKIYTTTQNIQELTENTDDDKILSFITGTKLSNNYKKLLSEHQQMEEDEVRKDWQEQWGKINKQPQTWTYVNSIITGSNGTTYDVKDIEIVKQLNILLEEVYQKELTGGAGDNMTDLVDNLISVLTLLTPESGTESGTESESGTDIISLIDILIDVLDTFNNNNKQPVIQPKVDLNLNEQDKQSLAKFIVSDQGLYKYIKNIIDDLKLQIKQN